MSEQPTSTICPSCGSLVGVKDEKCYVCGRPQPGLFGLTPVLRGLGGDLGFLQIVFGGCGLLYLASLALTARLDPDALQEGGGPFGSLGALDSRSFLLGASGAVPVFSWAVGGPSCPPAGCTGACSTLSST